nr:hypothetical protein CFP56_57077 [Quercus suber]
MGRSLRDGGEEGEMGFWKEENTPASNWGCLPKDGFLTWALRRRRTDVGLPSSISGGRGTLRRHRLS